MEDESSQEEKDMAMLQAAVESLGEHFDAVHIFASRHEAEVEGGTVAANWGVGNWYARFGQIREWIVKTDERAKVAVRHEDDED